MKKPFDKNPSSYDEQIKRLRKRGLEIKNEDKARHILKVIGYYRITAYLYPLQEDKVMHEYRTGACFNDAFKMYCFDRELRLRLLGDIEKIEVAIRSKLTYVLSLKYGSKWYADKSNFISNTKHKDSIKIIERAVKKSKETFILEFEKKYSDKYLPSWMALEVVTFTYLSKVYENLSDTSAKQEISSFFGMHYKVFESWLEVLSYNRNIFAHHSRFWNKKLSISPMLPKKLSYSWVSMDGIDYKKSYFSISVIKYMLDRVNPKNTLNSVISDLFDKYKTIDYKALGFPNDWREQSIWKE